MNRKNWRHGVGAFFAVMMMLAPLLTTSDAFANTWSGRGSYRGYFDDDPGNSSASPCPGHRSPVLYNSCYKRDAVPGNLKSGDDMYDFLRDTYYNPQGNGGKWDRTGASFIVNTMLGNDPPGKRSITTSMWADLKDRLNDDDLKYSRVNNVGSGDYPGDFDTFYQYSQNDVAYYKNDDNDDGRAYVFKYKGKTVYVLLIACGNPVGNFNGFPPPTKQNTPAWKAVPDTDVYVEGNVISWRHSVVNAGPDKTGANVTYRYVNGTGFAPGTGPAQTYPSGRTANDTDTFTSSQPFDPVADAGKTFCRATQASPRSSTDNSTVTSGFECYKVPVSLNYQLTPFATFNDGGTSAPPLEPGQGGTQVKYGVSNGGSSVSAETGWELTRCVYAAGGPALTTGTTNGSDAAATYGGACTSADDDVDTYAANETKNYGPATENAAGLGAGTTICYIMSVTPPGSGTGGYRHSTPACVKILKSPKVQILGADGRAGSIYTAGPKYVNGTYYGSWAQYGLFGVGGITGMSSAGGLAGGAGSVPASRQNALTFANNGGGGCTLGCFYSETPVQGDFTSYNAIPGPAATGAGETIANGTREVRHANGNLTISGNITYSGSYADPTQIPRVIIVVNGDITIADGVTRIDAWLIATGTVYTCASFTNPSDTAQRLTTSRCNQPLTFNGPVTAGKVLLGRTAGADASPASRLQAAETFNLAPSNYLSGYSVGQSQSNIQTVYEKELPPRY